MKALLIVDVQNDFLPGGSMGINRGDEIIAPINRLMELPFDFIVASKDWHPNKHGSFSSVHRKKTGETIILNGIEQILWPDHCIQGTFGAELSAKLNKHRIQGFVHKGTEENLDSYSTFFDNDHRKSTGLDLELKKRGIDELYIAGLSTDYCVKFSTLDALELGYHVYVIKDACKAINLHPDDEARALSKMRAKGATILTESQVQKTLSKKG